MGGITLPIMRQALLQAREGRKQILGKLLSISLSTLVYYDLTCMCLKIDGHKEIENTVKQWDEHDRED